MSARRILTVSQLNRLVAGMLERQVPVVRVSGEISNFTRAASGHWYFTLKDASAQVRAVMFRGRAQHVRFSPREGMRVEVSALPGLYEARGEFQLGVESMRLAGAGDLYQQFVQIKEALQREGLFDPGRKRPIPAWPRTIGVITSPSGAALHDVLSTLRRRAPAGDVIVYPSLVQGADAAARLRAALQAACRRAECDVLLIVRGGGSIEDLWAFNDEALARAIAAAPMPVISGVGHETDFTICDFVADLRAPTPTAAAAAATPDRRELAHRLAVLTRQLARVAARLQQQREQRLDLAARLLRPPSAAWRQRADRLDALAVRLDRAWRQSLRHHDHRLQGLRARLRAPDTRERALRWRQAARRLALAGPRRLDGLDQRLEQLAQRLRLASPRDVLARGYAIVRDEQGRIVRDAQATHAGQSLDVLLGTGRIAVTRR
ncbi:MAG: exodeoxyribonuclease VII large subunit [Burkholderiaceae bacterium]